MPRCWNLCGDSHLQWLVQGKVVLPATCARFLLASGAVRSAWHQSGFRFLSGADARCASPVGSRRAPAHPHARSAAIHAETGRAHFFTEPSQLNFPNPESIFCQHREPVEHFLSVSVNGYRHPLCFFSGRHT